MLGNVKIVHPCDAWARSAGQDSWVAALTAMKAGRVLIGRAPTVGKSAFGLMLFMEQVQKEGLHCYVDDFGQAMLGLRENFNAEVLEHQERRAAVLSRLSE